MAKDSVTIKNEDLAVEEHGNKGKSGCQDALDFQKKITPRSRDSEQALNSRLISGMQTVLCTCCFLSHA
jgi:hypothetical protein